MNIKKILRLNELLKEELGFLLQRNIEFPEGCFLTITRVDVSPDLQHARVYISIIPEEKTKDVLSVLMRNVFAIQQLVNKRLRMHPIPKIEWVKDAHTKDIQKVDELLEKIKNRASY